VLSALRTNDAPSTLMRLVDMGTEPYRVAATVVGILAQRLCRRICTHCKQPYEVRSSELCRFGVVSSDPDQMITLYRGAGCDMCRQRGYKGRVGLYELLTVNERIAELIVRGAPVVDIREAAKQAGMLELREDGLVKILEGVTTPDEVVRVVFIPHP